MKNKDKKDVPITDLMEFPEQAKPSTINHRNVTPDLSAQRRQVDCWWKGDHRLCRANGGPVSARTPQASFSCGRQDDAGKRDAAAHEPSLLRWRSRRLCWLRRAGFDFVPAVFFGRLMSTKWQLLDTPGKEDLTEFALTSEQAIKLLEEAVAAAEKLRPSLANVA